MFHDHCKGQMRGALNTAGLFGTTKRCFCFAHLFSRSRQVSRTLFLWPEPDFFSVLFLSCLEHGLRIHHAHLVPGDLQRERLRSPRPETQRVQTRGPAVSEFFI